MQSKRTKKGDNTTSNNYNKSDNYVKKKNLINLITVSYFS